MIALKLQKLDNHTIIKFLLLIDLLKSRGGRILIYLPNIFNINTLPIFIKWSSRIGLFLI